MRKRQSSVTRATQYPVRSSGAPAFGVDGALPSGRSGAGEKPGTATWADMLDGRRNNSANAAANHGAISLPAISSDISLLSTQSITFKPDTTSYFVARRLL